MRIKILIAALVLMIILLTATNPQSLPSVALIVPFVLLFAICALILKSVQAKFNKYPSNPIIILISGAVVVLAGLQSLGQLTLRDFIMVFALFIVASLYLHRRSSLAG